MDFKFYLLISLALFKMISGAGVGQSTVSPLFATDLYHNTVDGKVKENVILSPVSIQTCMALAFFGAEGRTAEEMVKGLHLDTLNKQTVAGKFEHLLDASQSSSDSVLTIANKLYANKGYEIKPEFNEVATKSFRSEAQTLDFSKSSEAVKTMNTWVESKTNNKIQNLLQDGSVDGDTSMVLINAIYFKGKWDKPFTAVSTHKADFFTSPTESVSVDMMFGDEKLKYGTLENLDATALEMPYKNSEMSMMILLPNQRDGLKDLETKMKDVNILTLTENMKEESVDIFLPKFKIEFSIKLNDVLKKMGMTTMFTDNADFSNLFKSTVPVKVSEVQHKAFIDVNEAGSEAAAATFMKIVPMSLNIHQKTFRADHPFMFLIKDKNAVYFMGHVAKF